MTALTILSLILAAVGGLPSGVLWAAGFAAFVGFIFGSVPPTGENRGWRFDLPGAILWAISAALIVGGLSTFVVEQGAVWPLAASGLGFALAGFRIASTRPARTPRERELVAGINRVEGDTPKAKLKAARRLFHQASFRSGENYWASRGLKEFHFGSAGMSFDGLELLKDGVSRAFPDTFDILVLLVTRLPGEENEPGVVVIRGAENLRRLKFGGDYFEAPGVGKVQMQTVYAMVGYAWR